MEKDQEIIKQSKNNSYKSKQKSRAIYKIEANNYKKQIKKEISKFYQTSNNELENNINEEAKTIATKLELNNRIKQLPKVEYFIKLKDHKESFSK